MLSSFGTLQLFAVSLLAFQGTGLGAATREQLRMEEKVQSLNETLQNLTRDYLDGKDAQDHNSDDFYLLVMGALVYLMQAGFAFLEAGNVRYQNVTNTLFRNFLGSVLSCFAYFIYGWAFSFGERVTGTGNPFIGDWEFALYGLKPERRSLWFFEYVFAAATTSIVSGAIAERCDVKSYFTYTLIVPGFIYAVVTHWTWVEYGWLNHLKVLGLEGRYKDFAGSGAVHVCGGTCALMGAIILGPRIGMARRLGGKLFPSVTQCKRTRISTECEGNGVAQNGVDHTVPQTEEDTDFRGHSVPLSVLGGFLLMFAFFGFNGGSLLRLHGRQDNGETDGQVVSLAIMNTIICGSLAGASTAIFYRIFHGRFSVVQAVNGCLAGMVAICSGCNTMYPWCAAVTGFIAGLVYLLWAWIIPKLKIDDPLETTALHLGGGSWGCIATAFFDRTVGDNGVNEGIVFGVNQVSMHGLLCQIIGLVSIVTWGAVIAGTMFGILRLLHVFRVKQDAEIEGLDVQRHHEPAYAVYTHKVSAAPDRLHA